MISLLNNIAAIIYEGIREVREVKGLLLGIDEQKEETLEIMNELGQNKNAIKKGMKRMHLQIKLRRKQVEPGFFFLILLSKQQTSSTSGRGKRVQGAKKPDEASKQSIEARRRQIEKDVQIDAQIQKEQSEKEEQER